MEIEGMTCTGCEESINFALKEQTGVVSATSSYKTGIVHVKDDQTKVKPEAFGNSFASLLPWQCLPPD